MHIAFCCPLSCQHLKISEENCRKSSWHVWEMPFSMTHSSLSSSQTLTNLVLCKRWVPQSHILPCSVFQIKVIRFKLLKILEKGRWEERTESQKQGPRAPLSNP